MRNNVIRIAYYILRITCSPYEIRNTKYGSWLYVNKVVSMPSRGLAVSYQIIRGLLRLAMSLLARTHVQGSEVVPRSGGAVVVCNHIAAVDPAILVGVFPRPLVLMSKIENARG